MNLNLTSPPTLQGDERQQLNQIRSYLYQMQQQLQIALENVTPEGLSQAAAAQVVGGTMPDNTAPTLADTYRKLKSIIIKTADTVREEMDEIVTLLEGSFVANSTFGTYQEEVSNRTRVTATDIVQSYQYDSKLDVLDEAMQGAQDALAALDGSINGTDILVNALQTYNISTEQYIKTGLLFFDDQNVPRYGVAVGEKLTTVVVNGETVLERSGLAATFTSDRLSFWQNDIEVAYVSNNKLYINEVSILSRLFLGDWVIDRSNGFVIKWVG